MDRLWDPAEGMFFCRDVRTGDLVPERSVAGLIPLLLPALPRDIAAALVGTACGPHFGLGDTTRLVPSYDLTGEAFDPHRYWRGPAWFNTNWLLERGLRLHGERGGPTRCGTRRCGPPTRPGSPSTWTRTPVRRAGRSASAGPPRSRSICCTSRTSPTSPSDTTCPPWASARFGTSDMNDMRGMRDMKDMGGDRG